MRQCIHAVTLSSPKAEGFYCYAVTHKNMRAWMKKKRLVAVVIIIIVLSALALWSLADRNNFEQHYLRILADLDTDERHLEVLSWLGRYYNFTDLLDWVHWKLDWVPENETFERNTDPGKILECGKGRCEEFTILYVAACMAQGYRTRIVVSVDTGNPWLVKGLHVWAEVKSNGWVHVDPSDRVWNKPHRYQTWEWGKDIGTNVKIYAFENRAVESERVIDLTSNYQ